MASVGRQPDDSCAAARGPDISCSSRPSSEQINMSKQKANSASKLSLVEGHIALGDVYRNEGNLENALAEYQKAIDGDSTAARAYAVRGAALIDVGRFREAIGSLEAAIELRPDFASPYQGLGSLARNGEYEFTDTQLRCIENLLSRNDMPTEEVCELCHTLGDTFDARGDYDAAFQAYRRANEARQQTLSAARPSFNANAFERRVEAAIETFDESFFKSAESWGLASDLPVFVVGMPRSGTTLVEQILASHPNVEGVGERLDLARIASDLPELTGGSETYPHCAANLTPAITNQLAEKYLSDLGTLGGKITRFVDKTPTNFLFVGLILALFPKARFIHCRRDPRDIALSCYFQNFAGVQWSYRLEDIAWFYRGYTRVMKHWHRMLPDRVHDVTYEELVNDTEKTSREMVASCGLAWSAGCLDYYRQRSAVQTPSRVQVRQPIYTKSVARWKHYEAHLAPFTASIEPLS